MSAVMVHEGPTVSEVARWSVANDGEVAALLKAYRPSDSVDGFSCPTCHRKFNSDEYVLHLIRSGHGVDNPRALAALRREAIYNMVASGTATTSHTIAAALGLQVELVIYHLAKLRKEGRVKMVGSARLSHYEAIPTTPPSPSVDYDQEIPQQQEVQDEVPAAPTPVTPPMRQVISGALMLPRIKVSVEIEAEQAGIYEELLADILQTAAIHYSAGRRGVSARASIDD